MRHGPESRDTLARHSQVPTMAAHSDTTRRINREKQWTVNSLPQIRQQTKDSLSISCSIKTISHPMQGNRDSQIREIFA